MFPPGFVVGLLLVPGFAARSLYDDVISGKAPLSKDAFFKFLDQMNELNKIQADILEVPVTSFDAPFFSVAQQQDSKKPDEIPYLFEGDMILTERQMDIIIKNARDQFWARSGPNTLKKLKRGRRSMTSDLSLRWPFPVPFYINTGTGVDSKSVLAGVAKWQETTCVTFRQLNSLPPYGNALEFIQGSG